MISPINIFVIPSWYPSLHHPLAGIFFYEQALLFARHYPQSQTGISHWGQNDERLLLWRRDHFLNLLKIWEARRLKPSHVSLSKNVNEYFEPAFTWSMKVVHGNMDAIIRANAENLRKFETEVENVDLIHAHVGYPAGYIAMQLSKQSGIPYIITEHMSPLPFEDYVDKKGHWMKKLNLAYQNAARIIAVSHAMEAQLRRQGFSHTECIHNFIDDDYFKPVTKTKANTVECLVIARMTPQKGIDILLQSLASIKEQIGQLHFTLIGGGECLEEYQRLALNLGLENKISWKGEQSRKKVKEYLLQCDLLILPSRHESFGIAVIEALACGKPCVVTRCGGPEEIVSGEVGRVVEKENPEALAEALIDVARNLDQYPATKVRAYFEKHFSAKMATSRLVKVYEEVINAEKTI